MATNMVNNLFSPQVETFQPAFIYNTSPNISFSISPFNTAADIRYLHVSVIDQRNNENALVGLLPQAYNANDAIAPEYFQTNGNNGYGLINGILIIDFPSNIDKIQPGELIQYDRKTDKYVVSIPTNILRQDKKVKIDNPIYDTTQFGEDGSPVLISATQDTKYFNVGQYYKIQLRFDSCTEENLSDLSSGMAKEVDTAKKQDLYERFINYLIRYRHYFSEWSEVTLIKPILHVNFNFPQLDGSILGEQNGLKGLNQGIIPLSASVIMKDKLYYLESVKDHPDMTAFKDSYVDGLVDETEHVERFRFTVYPMDEQGIVDYETINYLGDWEYTTVREDTTSVEYGINTIIELQEKDAGQYHALVIEYYTNNNYYGKDIRYFESNLLETRLKDPWWHDLQDTEHRKNPKFVQVNQEDGIVKIRFRWDVKEASRDLDFSPSDGILYLRRASSLDNFKTWKLMSVTFHQESEVTENENFVIALDFDDYTVCSLVRYKYSVQYHMLKSSTHGEDKGKVIQAAWTKSYESAEVYPSFYNMLLQRQNRQIAIRYNGQVSSWKPVVNRQKVDTLGGRYPKFVENAQMNYRQFSINGLISAEGDFNRTFLNEFDGEFVKHVPTEEKPIGDYVLRNGKYVFAATVKDGEQTYDWKYFYNSDMQAYNKYFDGKYMLRNDTTPDGEYGYNPKLDKNEYSSGVLGYKKWMLTNCTVAKDLKEGYDLSVFTDEYAASYVYGSYSQHDLYPTDNWYWERLFRDELVKWLNDGEPKLYRSMPEGNMAVMLADINLTPNPQLGRRLYNFSATVYEIGDGNDLDVLDSLGIYNAPKLVNKYGEISVIPSPDLDDDDDEEEDEAFTSGITQLGQMWLPKIYGFDLINGSSGGSSAEDESGPIWDEMTIAERIKTQYLGRFADYSVKGTVNLDWVRFQFVSNPKYYTSNYNSLSLPGAKWKPVDMIPFSDKLSKNYTIANDDYTSVSNNYTGKPYNQTVKNKNTQTNKKRKTTLTDSDTFEIKASEMQNYNGKGIYKKWVVELKDENQYSIFDDKITKISQELQEETQEETQETTLEILSFHPSGNLPPVDNEYAPPVLYDVAPSDTSRYNLDFIAAYLCGLEKPEDIAGITSQILDSSNVRTCSGKAFKKIFENIFLALSEIKDDDTFYYNYDTENYTLNFYLLKKPATICTFAATNFDKNLEGKGAYVLRDDEYKLITEENPRQNDEDTYDDYIVYSWTKAPSAKQILLQATATKIDGEIFTPNCSWIRNSQIFVIKNIGNLNCSKITITFKYEHEETLVLNLEDENPLSLDSSTLSLGYNFWLNNSGIFVNDRGFYQVPDKTKISNITLRKPEFTGDHYDKVIIDYKATYKRLHDTSNIPVRTIKIEKIVGQWGGVFPYTHSVHEDIYNKYYYVKYMLPNTSGQYEWMVDFPEYYSLNNNDEFIRTNQKIAKVKKEKGYWKLYSIEDNTEVKIEKAKNYNFESKEQAMMWLWMADVGESQQQKLSKEYVQYLDTWKGVSVDVTPYAVLQVRYKGYLEDTTLVVGRSGVLSLWDDNEVEEITFMGRRMVQAPRSRQPYLDEWEYVLDELLSIEFGLDEATQRVDWINWYNNRPEQTRIEVAFAFGYTVKQMEDALQSITESMKRRLWPFWLKTYYNKTTEIHKPQYNTVYPIASNGQTYYYIYYIDDEWYPIEPYVEDSNKMTIADMKKHGTIVAQVPIYGYVNYHAEIKRSYL